MMFWDIGIIDVAMGRVCFECRATSFIFYGFFMFEKKKEERRKVT
jgi:hypothetical protein